MVEKECRINRVSSIKFGKKTNAGKKEE